MMGYYGGFSWLGMLPMTLLWVGVLALIVWGIVSLVRRPVAEIRPPSALDTLKERYARGDIDRSEFEQKRKELS